jgi:hypothetical protein
MLDMFNSVSISTNSGYNFFVFSALLRCKDVRLPRITNSAFVIFAQQRRDLRMARLLKREVYDQPGNGGQIKNQWEAT